MTKIRFERTAGLAAAAFCAFALPAQATNTTSSTSSNRPAPETSQRSDNAESERRICVRIELSGSHVTRRVCKTAQEWEAAGGLPTADR
jgi:hypothetical protein